MMMAAFSFQTSKTDLPSGVSSFWPGRRAQGGKERLPQGANLAFWTA
jgi:hypothetical protein